MSGQCLEGVIRIQSESPSHTHRQNPITDRRLTQPDWPLSSEQVHYQTASPWKNWLRRAEQQTAVAGGTPALGRREYADEDHCCRYWRTGPPAARFYLVLGPMYTERTRYLFSKGFLPKKFWNLPQGGFCWNLTYLPTRSHSACKLYLGHRVHRKGPLLFGKPTKCQ